ncbi:unnamed protein product [Calicophoron daubneyi]|uniref:Dipeptidyl peptidase 3 n=1 Tax=Calicophoron daubneyi TaxID=300641 RepID=A0AAV2T6J1_CALDB
MTSAIRIVSSRVCTPRDLALKGRRGSATLEKMSSDVAPLSPVCCLDVDSFLKLDSKEKLYAHTCSQSAWIGGLIGLVQLSPEAAGLFIIFQRIFRKQNPTSLHDVALSNDFTEEEIEKIYSYIAMFYGNLGDYLSYGDRKFIPDISQQRFTEFLALSPEYKGIANIWKSLAPAVYSLHPRRLQLDFGPSGLTTYYSSNCTRYDAELVQNHMKKNMIEGYNTRLFKKGGPESRSYILRIASAKKATCTPSIDPPITVTVERGDYCELMELLVRSIELIKPHTLNSEELAMWSKYSESFETGDISAHKSGSALWVKDKAPAVENYIGFIETYRDPFGVRAEFEGFVAMVNRGQSTRFGDLVDCAEDLLKFLPWPRTYEKDLFLRPDFTSLDVITFASSGIPLGINIPNYDDIRQDIGFKNVSLGNVIVARFKDPHIQYLTEEDKAIFREHIVKSEEVAVGLHELLGHGSGKLFKEDEEGRLNFDPNSTEDLLTGGHVEHWYKPGETYDSKFLHVSSAMEECRAECVSLYLCNLPKVLEIFGGEVVGINDEVVSDVTYLVWLSLIRSGLMGLKWYKPTTKSWGQAHCCARYVILRALLNLNDPFLHIEEIVAEDGKPDLVIHLDRSKLVTVARPAVGRLLSKLQYYRSTGNSELGTEFFTSYSTVLESHYRWRDIIVDRQRPHPLFIQPVTRLTETNEVELLTYPATYTGLIQSFVDRFNSFEYGLDAIEALEKIWQRDQAYFEDIPV